MAKKNGLWAGSLGKLTNEGGGMLQDVTGLDISVSLYKEKEQPVRRMT